MSRRGIILNLALALPVVGALAARAEEPPAIVQLERSPGWSVGEGEGAHQGALSREIARQAFLLAARAELRLATRDAWLGEQLTSEGDNLPFDVICSAGAPSLLEVVRGVGGQQTLLWQHELKVRARPFDYADFVTQIEALSRGEFVEVLKQAGFQRREAAEPQAAAGPSAEEIESWLNEMTFVPQFAAVREVHRQIQQRAESPRLLDQLARGYANLGVLSEYLWNPMHEVFKARALLYAERFVVRGKSSPTSLACRGYVRAAIGLHAAALEDFAAVAAARQQLPEGSRKPLPGWVSLMEGFCRFDAKALQVASDSEYVQLAALLRLLVAEQSDTPRLVPRVAVAEYLHAPECYRIQDGFEIRYFESWEERYQRTDEDFPLPPSGEQVLASTLYKRLLKLSDLPTAVRSLLANQAAARAVVGGGEPELRGKVIQALLTPATEPAAVDEAPQAPAPGKGKATKGKAAAKTAGRAPSKTSSKAAAPVISEPAEMPWSLLGQLIEEVSFYQAWRVLRPDRRMKHDESQLIRLLPSVPTHRLRSFLELVRADTAANRKAVNALLRARVLDSLSLRQLPIVQVVAGPSLEAARIFRKMRAEIDDLPGDVALCMSFYEYGSSRGAHHLATVTPFAPMVRANLINSDWKQCGQFAADWERSSATQPRVLAEIGRQYLKERKLSDAERLLKASAQVEPTAEALGDLAEVYDRLGNGTARLDALQRLLAVPDLDNPEQTQAQIAAHYMSVGDWKLAQSFADQAAASNTTTGHLAAADVYEALQQWDQAERHYRAVGQDLLGQGEPLRAEFLEWDRWCQRIGQGDAAAAHRAALASVQRRAGWQKDCQRSHKQLLVEGTFYLLASDHKQARSRFDEEFAASHDPVHGLLSALCNDRLQDTSARDKRLSEMAKTKAGWQQANPDRPQAKLYELAALLAADLAQGGKAALDAARLKSLLAGGNEAESIDVCYFLGEYYSLHQQPKSAAEAWQACMIRLPMRSFTRTLAGHALCKASIPPASYFSELKSRKAVSAANP